jgi:N-sulfoglucosamine sulfohydrolase
MLINQPKSFNASVLRLFRLSRLALFLTQWLLVSNGAIAGQSPPAPPKQPNILWLIAEDFGPQLGCYGTKEVWTPNLDSLAAQGIRYTRAFTTAPVCSASRSAFITGM